MTTKLNQFKILSPAAVACLLGFSSVAPAQTTTLSPAVTPAQTNLVSPVAPQQGPTPLLDSAALHPPLQRSLQHPRTATSPIQAMALPLGLTDDQVKKLKPILDEQQSKISALRRDNTLSRRERMIRLQELHTQADSNITKVITPEQAQKWRQMRSAPMLSSSNTPAPFHPATASPRLTREPTTTNRMSLWGLGQSNAPARASALSLGQQPQQGSITNHPDSK